MGLNFYLSIITSDEFLDANPTVFTLVENFLSDCEYKQESRQIVRKVLYL